jgi:hypothetical protein
MAIPGGSVRTIGDLIPGVTDALQQRTDIASLVPKYIRKALIELTESNPFEELRRTGPVVTTNLSTNPVSAFLNNGDDYNYPEVFTIFVDSPTNTVKDTLDYKTPKAIEIMTSPVTTGIPKYWTRFGSSFRFAPVPFKTFTLFLQYQVKHPFPGDPNDAVALAGQQLFITDSWEEIVEYSAALRIAIVKRWNDQALVLHNLLYGDPSAGTGTDGKLNRPGLIQARKFQVERDQQFNSRSLGIRVGRYNPR